MPPIFSKPSRPYYKGSSQTSTNYSERTLLRGLRLAYYDVKDIVSPEISAALSWFAMDGRTKEPAVLMALLELTASVIAGQIALKPHRDVNHHIVPALMMLIAGNPGSGKSHPVETHCLKVLKAIQIEHQRKIYDRPANSSCLRKLIKETDCKCSVIGDKFNKILTDLTTVAAGMESVAYLNSGWSGGRLTASFTKAISFDCPDSCITCYGAIHPPTLANMIQSWDGGEGLKERWLFSVVGDDIPVARMYLQHKLSKSEPPFNIEATFKSLFDYCEDHDEIIDLVLSEAALERYLTLSEEISMQKKARCEAIGRGKDAAALMTSAKDEELILKLSMVLHVLENALLSFRNTGSIDIPEEVPLLSFERAISYVYTSKQVLKIFGENKAFTSPESEMLLIPGKVLTPAIISEATRQRNRFTFAEPKEFLKLAKKMHHVGIGQLTEVKIQRGQAFQVEDVYFKPSPSNSLVNSLTSLDIALEEYEESYSAKYSIRPSQKALAEKVLLYEQYGLPHMNPAPHTGAQTPQSGSQAMIASTDEEFNNLSESESDSETHPQPPKKHKTGNSGSSAEPEQH